jgi:hypothetical protein
VAAEPGSAAVIGDLRTGSVAETIRPPAGDTIAGVAGASDGSTFVIDMTEQPKPGQATALSRHQFLVYRAAEAGGAPLRRSVLALSPPTTREAMLGLALSPDGTRLAVLSVASSEAKFALRVYSTGTGEVQHQWTMKLAQSVEIGGGDNSDSLTWSGNAIAFQPSPMLGDTPGVRVLVLNASDPGDDLMAASRAVSVPSSGFGCADMLLSQDATTIICGGRSGSCAAESEQTGSPGIAEYSARTGQLDGVLYVYGGRCAWGITDLFWSNASGSAVAAATALGTGTASDSPTEQVTGVYTGHGVTPLPLHLKVNGDLALDGWNPVAF